jgi:hypothetical protein
MRNNELQLTDLEYKVLEVFCYSYCEHKMSYDPPLLFFSMKSKNLETLKNLQDKGFIKLVQRYNTNSFNQIINVITGYMPTDKLKSTALYKRIDYYVKFGNRRQERKSNGK